MDWMRTKFCRKENKMSRQMRSQMPQVQKKKFDRNACLLVFTLIFVGILIFSLLTASDNKKLNRTLIIRIINLITFDPRFYKVKCLIQCTI